MPVKCLNCDVRNPHITDVVIGEKSDFVPPEEPTGIVFDMIAKIDKMEPKGRWDFWMDHFTRCIKCYACRQACSLCYCERCITEKNMPQWIETSATPRGNLSWNLDQGSAPYGTLYILRRVREVVPGEYPAKYYQSEDGPGRKRGLWL